MTSLADLRALPSSLRTPEQMRWILDRFKPDGLERLSRANEHYCEQHPEYLPDVAALAHAALERVAAAEAERDALRTALSGLDGAAEPFDRPFGYPHGLSAEDCRKVQRLRQAREKAVAVLAAPVPAAPPTKETP